MGEWFRPFGHIERKQIFRTGVVLELASAGDIGVENELVFRFGDPVPEGASGDEIRDCIEAVAAGFELNQVRLPRDASSKDRLADNLSQWGIVVGELVTDWWDLNLNDLHVNLFQDDALVETVQSARHIDCQFDALFLLNQQLNRFDRTIEKGDYVISGAFTKQRVTRPSSWRGDFGDAIGTVEVTWR